MERGDAGKGPILTIKAKYSTQNAIHFENKKFSLCSLPLLTLQTHILFIYFACLFHTIFHSIFSVSFLLNSWISYPIPFISLFLYSSLLKLSLFIFVSVLFALLCWCWMRARALTHSGPRFIYRINFVDVENAKNAIDTCFNKCQMFNRAETISTMTVDHLWYYGLYSYKLMNFFTKVNVGGGGSSSSGRSANGFVMRNDFRGIYTPKR